MNSEGDRIFNKDLTCWNSIAESVLSEAEGLHNDSWPKTCKSIDVKNIIYLLSVKNAPYPNDFNLIGNR